MKKLETSVDIFEGRPNLLKIKDQSQALFRNVFGRPMTDKAWEHYYLNSPYGTATVCGITEDGKMVAHGGIIPQKLVSTDGKEISYYLQTAVMVDEAHRNLMFFKKLMDTIHKYVLERNRFVIAFPNDSSYAPFIKLLRWELVTEFSIDQYVEGVWDGADRKMAPEHRYNLSLDEQFLKWRGEINNLKVIATTQNKVVYKDYEGALEILYASGADIEYKRLMSSLGYEKINIPNCFISCGRLEGLKRDRDVGIPQRFCIYPAANRQINYADIKPSLLLSDVF